jgi:hypothetical protein
MHHKFTRGWRRTMSPKPRTCLRLTSPSSVAAPRISQYCSSAISPSLASGGLNLVIDTDESESAPRNA